MQIQKLAAFSALCLFLAHSAAAPKSPVLRVKVLDARTVVVHGTNFPSAKLLVSADMDMPHASVACYSEFMRVAIPEKGGFEVVINPSKISDCDFSCGREPVGYVVTASDVNDAVLAQTKFACVPRRAVTGK